MAEDNKQSFSRGRRTWFFLSAWLNTFSILVLISVVNYLAAGWYQRFEWSDLTRLQLSPQTLKILELVTNEVNVTIVFDQQGEEDLYHLVSGTLREYAAKNPKINLRSIDLTRQDAEAKLLLAQHKLANLSDKNFVLFELAGRTRAVFANELSDYDINAVIAGESEQFRRTHFKGEMLFSAGLFSLLYGKEIKAYFLTGHGEHDPYNIEGEHGYGRFGQILSNEHNVVWSTLDLRRTNAVPADCQLLVIAGQKGKLADNEHNALTNYFQQGGRALVLLNNVYTGGRAGIEYVLTNFGVGSADSIVFDEQFSPTGQDLLTANMNPNHPVTRSLVKDDLKVRLIVPRPLGKYGELLAGVEAPKVDRLLWTSEGAVEQAMRQGATSKQRKGSFILALSLEQGSIKGLTGDRGAMRMVVVGDSLFLDNEIIQYTANHYFASQAVGWLLSRPQFMLEGLGPRPVKDYTIMASGADMRFIRILFLGVFPGVILTLGLLVWFGRRR